MLEGLWRQSWLITLLVMAFAPIVEAKASDEVQAKATHRSQRQGKVVGRDRAMGLHYEKIFDRGSVSAAVIDKPLAKALEALLEPSEELESPINNAKEMAAGRYKSNWPQDRDLQLKIAGDSLIDYFNRVGTELVLLEEGKKGGRGFAPERGEDLKMNWVFSLTIPSLSDHIYWIVVAKEPPYKAYVYGFN
ncbi:MAG: hypothetical protein H7318_06610 [Oligoflexus sp.]|nr:hypothetical protein [Oligoflexus sp.]